MRTHQPLQKGSNCFGQQEEMETHTPKAAGRKASSFRTVEHSFSVHPSSAVAVAVGIARPASTRHRPLVSREILLPEERQLAEHESTTDIPEEDTSNITYPLPPTPPHYLEFQEEFAQIIMTIHPNPAGKELVEAFREGSELPPITKESLSELDIQKIITNIKLRHNINFDRNISFRPNLGGVEGLEKIRRYYTALVAELELYARLFQSPTTLKGPEDSRQAALAHHAKRRIPALFQTVHEVLKSLLPDRDHSRVDEQLDVPMLMQEIERGIFDMVRLGEWMAQLLKEHCAPMRDRWVDKMVDYTREGVAKHSSEKIVKGLTELLGILEAMKLDVANHQIRNLKTLLIEDTINFEKHYHLEILINFEKHYQLDRLTNHRPHVNIPHAQAWYSCTSSAFAESCPPRVRNTPQVQLEIFIRAVIAHFFKSDKYHEFPDTFYLDQDRLRTLKAEIDDLIHLEVCMDMFAVLLKQFGYDRPISLPMRHQLHTSLAAIMGEAVGYGSRQWFMNSEALSLEILRQASFVAGQALAYDHVTLFDANNRLHYMFHNAFTTHNPRLEAALLHRVLACTCRHTSSTLMDLFNHLAPVGNMIPLPQTHFAHLNMSTPNPETAKWQDIANRISHIIILHWRVWDRIAYIREDATERSSSPSTEVSITSTPQPVQSPLQATEHDPQIVTTMRTGESLESGQETHIAPETPLQ